MMSPKLYHGKTLFRYGSRTDNKEEMIQSKMEVSSYGEKELCSAFKRKSKDQDQGCLKPSPCLASYSPVLTLRKPIRTGTVPLK